MKADAIGGTTVPTMTEPCAAQHTAGTAGPVPSARRFPDISGEIPETPLIGLDRFFIDVQRAMPLTLSVYHVLAELLLLCLC